MPKIIEYAKFGNKLISVTDLESNPPKLNIRYPNKTSVHDYRKIEISPEMADILFKIIKDPEGVSLRSPEGVSLRSPNANDIDKNNLCDEEKHLMGLLLHRTTVRRDPNYIQRERGNIQHKKQHLKVLLGIREAGNDNPDIVLEILRLSKYLNLKGHLSKQMISDIIASVSEQMGSE